MTTSGSCQMRRPHNFNEIKNWSSDAAVLQVKETRRKDTLSVMPILFNVSEIKTWDNAPSGCRPSLSTDSSEQRSRDGRTFEFQ